MVRHPLDRMVSAYVERLATPGQGQVFESINHAVRQQPMIIDSSRYWEVFDCYKRHFDESRIKIVWFEEFVKDARFVFDDVCEFLGIASGVEVDMAGLRQNRRDDAMHRMRSLGRGSVEVSTDWDGRTRQWVIDQIREDNVRFLEHFGKPTDYWCDTFA